MAVNPDAVRIIAKTITDRLRARQKNEEEQTRVEDAWRNIPDPYGLRLATASPEKILVINCGSSSLKYRYYDTADESNNLRGLVERIGLSDSSSHEEAFQAVVDLLTDKKNGVIKNLNELSAVGHRVVHGGDKYNHPVIIDEDVKSVLPLLNLGAGALAPSKEVTR